MNTVSNEIKLILDDIASRIGVVIDWTSDTVVPQLLEFLERLVTWLMVGHVFDMIPWILLSIIAYGLSRVVKRIKQDEISTYQEMIHPESGSNSYDIRKYLKTCMTLDTDGQYQGTYELFLVVSIVIHLICLIAVLGNIRDIVMLYIIPEVGIYEYISKFIN